MWSKPLCGNIVLQFLMFFSFLLYTLDVGRQFVLLSGDTVSQILSVFSVFVSRSCSVDRCSCVFHAAVLWVGVMLKCLHML